MAIQYHIYAGDTSGGPVDWSTIVATVSGLSWTSAALAASTDQKFGVRAFDTVTGLEEQSVDAQVRVTIDPSQRDVSGLPSPPVGLGVEPLAAGGYRVTWSWPRASIPTGFHLYLGTPAVSYASIIATVPYTGLPHYRFDGAGLTSGTAYQVAVRAYNAIGEEANVIVADVTASSVGPDSVEGLAASVI